MNVLIVNGFSEKDSMSKYGLEFIENIKKVI